MKKNEDFWEGVRVALALKNIKSVYDYAEIRRLNRRSSAAWIRGNNSGRDTTMKKTDKISDKCWAEAQVIAKQNRWEIHAPGLFWEIKKNGVVLY